MHRGASSAIPTRIHPEKTTRGIESNGRLFLSKYGVFSCYLRNDSMATLWEVHSDLPGNECTPTGIHSQQYKKKTIMVH